MENNIIWQNDVVTLEVEPHQIPWLKIMLTREVKEFSGCTQYEKETIWQLLDIIEKIMLEYYRCDKVNIASFGNMLPQVHFHIMARFTDDDYFPHPVWGEKQRTNNLDLPSFEMFQQLVINALNT